MDKLLNVSKVQTDFITTGKVSHAVVDATFDVHPGEIVGVVGESGSGKSVTMLSILKLVAAPGKVTGGEAYLSGQEKNLIDMKPQSAEIRSIRGGRISMIFQEPMTSLNPVLSVGYQISETILLHKKCSKAEAKQQAIEMMKAVRIPDAEERYHYYPQQFSGGMRQRIMIAIALAADPEILIADEATTALDVTIQGQLLEMLKDLAKSRNVAIIIVTHNMGVVARYADRIYVMYSGSVVECSETAGLFKHPEHPYTRGLLNSIPRLNDSRDRVLEPIEGLLPDPANRPPYCAFYDRCLYRCDDCKQGIPPLKETAAGHLVACHRTVEEIDAIADTLAVEKKAAPEKHIGTETVLEVKDLCKNFDIRSGVFQRKSGEVHALENVSFTVRKGETLGIVGESGCGKSTLARCIIRAYKPSSGSVVFNGEEVSTLPEKKLGNLRRRMAMVFQDPYFSLDPRQTAEGIVGESLTVHHLTQNKAEYDKRVDELFRLVELDPALKNRVPHEFSGGQRQRLGIARALSSDPSLIICDEPISALDVSVQAQIINLLEKLQSELGVSYLFIAHDIAVVRHISDRILVMYLGSVMEVADSDTICSNPMHPYTKALLASVPTADPELERTREHVEMRGEIPSVKDRPRGCPFCNRCEYAADRCRSEKPQLRTLADGRQIACFLYEEA